ncbi:M23 family metallopeptidase [Streptomyces sp. NPDC091377]|uniref:M23 family metallopeptidase n=1 Tax=Streptomyces sp. NPDC091377 TaxID=3365995 RepID=UPI00380197FA
MNDRHPSGILNTPASASDSASAPFPSYGSQEAPYGDFTTQGAHAANGFAPGAQVIGADHTAPPPPSPDFAGDPLFGELPGDPHLTTGTYDATQWSTGSHQTLNQDPYAAQHLAAHDSGSYDSTAWTDGYQHLSAVPSQPGPGDTGGQWDASAWLQPDQNGGPADATQHWEWGTQAFDTGAYDATQWNSAAPDDYSHGDDYGHGDKYSHQDEYSHGDEYGQQGEYPAQDGYAEPQSGESFHEQPTATFEQVTGYDEAPDPHGGQPHSADGELTATGELPAVVLLDGQEESRPATGSRAAARNASRSRRRAPAKRSALLTVAVPSACVMGVAGIAAASVGSLTGDDGKETQASAPDELPVKPAAANNQLDTQLAGLTAEADDFADRASRTQERIDLKAAQAAEKKRAAEEAARKERQRPKFALPVAQNGLSAYYGQSGINWMSLHSGIDFPVSYGTPVMAATDGTVRTQFDAAYGTMVILTAMDGTETWYCHLSSYAVASGTTVKAGDTIAYSGDSGNSTGPHLHFEVRPGGGAAVDPLAWLRSHGLDPT